MGGRKNLVQEILSHGDVLINFDPPPHVPIVVTLPHAETSLIDAPILIIVRTYMLGVEEMIEYSLDFTIACSVCTSNAIVVTLVLSLVKFFLYVQVLRLNYYFNNLTTSCIDSQSLPVHAPS